MRIRWHTASAGSPAISRNSRQAVRQVPLWRSWPVNASNVQSASATSSALIERPIGRERSVSGTRQNRDDSHGRRRYTLAPLQSEGRVP